MKSIDEIQRAVMLADLGGLECQLNHGGWTPDDNQAKDYLVLPVGPTETLENGVKVQEIDGHYVVPICQGCAETLAAGDKTWVLVFCVKCGENHWVLRQFAKMWYPDEMIVWTTACQFCIEQGENIGVYFQDKDEF